MDLCIENSNVLSNFNRTSLFSTKFYTSDHIIVAGGNLLMHQYVFIYQRSEYNVGRHTNFYLSCDADMGKYL